MMRGTVIALCAACMVGSVSAAEVSEGVKVKGDLRYRHEVLDQDNDAADPRHRQRLRARLIVEGKVSEEANIVVALATGSDDPVSTNQTLGSFFSTKNIGLDLAYFALKPSRLDGLLLVGGKMKNPFIMPGGSELIWDSDLNPEGGAVRFEHEMDNVSIAAVGSGLWLAERSSDDSWLGAGQASARLHFNEKKSSIMAGGSFYNYVNVAGVPLFFDKEDSFGNSTGLFDFGDGDVPVYAVDYELFEAFVEFAHQIGGHPLVLIADFVTNTAADSLNTGWLVGGYLGKLKNPGSWEFRYNYREVEQDAVLGVFTDSDFRGGGTNARGHEFGAGVQIMKNTAFSGSYFFNTVGIGEGDPEYDFNRLQLDLQLKF